MDPNDWKDRKIAVHIDIDPSDKNQIRTHKISADNFERHVEILPRDVTKLAVDPGMRLNPQKHRRGNLQIRADGQV